MKYVLASWKIAMATLITLSLHTNAYAGGGNGGDYSGPSLSSTSTPTGSARAFTSKDAENALKKCYGITYSSPYKLGKRTDDEIKQLKKNQLVKFSDRLYHDWIVDHYSNNNKPGNLYEYYSQMDLRVITRSSEGYRKISEKFMNSISVDEIHLQDAGMLSLSQNIWDQDGTRLTLTGADIESQSYFHWEAKGYLPYFQHDGEAKTVKYSKLGVPMENVYLKNLRVISPTNNYMQFYIIIKNEDGEIIQKELAPFVLNTQEYTDCLNYEITHSANSSK